jgi:undecaprenyl-diphosphatase
MQRNAILKGAIPMIAFWFVWFRRSTPPHARAALAATLAASVVAIAVGRILALGLPFRLRPMHDAKHDLTIVLENSDRILEGWSSFPSDHAVLFFAVATGLFIVDRWIGLLAFAHAVVVISLPRVVLGLHYPSDILAGGVVGVLVGGVIVTRLSRLHAWRTHVVNASEKWPELIYPFIFFITFQIATMFDDARSLVSALMKAAKLIVP